MSDDDINVITNKHKYLLKENDKSYRSMISLYFHDEVISDKETNI